MEEKVLRHRADLRVFGAIGFQDADNGLWLGKQGYRPQESLLHRIVNSAIRKGVDVVGITSEDDKMLKYSPEDRFGFLKVLIGAQNNEYLFAETEEGVIRATKRDINDGRGGIVYLVNSETRHQSDIQDWKGLKLHIVGGNLIPKNLDLDETVKYANERGYMTFLMNVGLKNQDLSDRVVHSCTGVIGHNATNAFPTWTERIPKIGASLKGYSKGKNKIAQEYAHARRVP